MSREAYSPPDPKGWLTRGLRLIFFPLEPQHKERRDWWWEMTGNEPDESSRRKEGVEEAGLLGPNRRLTVAVDPFRIQWSLDPLAETMGEIIEQTPVLGPFLEEKEKFLEQVISWLGKAPAIKRIGFATTLIYPVLTPVDGYQMLDRFLQTVDVDLNSSDFFYRVNRKARSKKEPVGTLLNQLMTWATYKITAKLMVPAIEGSAEVVVNETSFTLLELDVNTDHVRTDAFSNREIAGLSRELTDLAVARATAGDVRG